MHLRFRLTLTVLVVSILVVLNSEQLVSAKNSTTEEFPNEYQSHLEYVLELRNSDRTYQRLSPIIKNELFSTINQTSTDQNITLTIHDIYYFGNQFTYSYTLETEKDVNSDVWEHRSVLTPVRTEFERERMNSSGSFWDKEVSDGKYVGYAVMNVSKALPPEGELTLKFPQLFNTKGNWDVRFPVKEVSGENVDISSIENIDPSKVEILSAQKNDAELQVSLEVKENLHDNVLFQLFTEDEEQLNRRYLNGHASREDLSADHQSIEKNYIYNFDVPQKDHKKLKLRAENQDESEDNTEPFPKNLMEKIQSMFFKK